MRFTSTRCIIFVLIIALANASVVASLFIRRVPDPADIAKRVAIAQTTKGAKPAVASASTPRPSRASSSATNASASTSSSNTLSSTNTPAANTPSSTSGPDDYSTNTTATNALNATSTTPSSSTPPAPTGGISTPAVGGIAAVGGVAVIGAAVFAFMRYKRKSSLTQNLSNVNQFSGSAYNTSTPFPPGGTGYERLSDQQMSAASVPGGGGPQQGLGTFTVVSTYTPTLGDELEIQPGDKVTILVEYDDGWCQGVNESRGKVKGVFPKHCVDYNQGGMDDAGRGKRISSMYGSPGYRM